MSARVTITGLPQFGNFAAELERSIGGVVPQIYVGLAASSTSVYMRDAGIGAGRRDPADTGPLRIVSGQLARSLRGIAGGQESIRGFRSTDRGFVITYGSRTPHARPNEVGFDGVVQVPAHTRTITQAFGRPIPAKEVQVAAHSRAMHIPARPYLKPALRDQLPAISESIADATLQAVRGAFRR